MGDGVDIIARTMLKAGYSASALIILQKITPPR